MDSNSRDFYLHLLSDCSLHYFPNNVISEFTTKLPHDVNLPGQWQVALCNISYHKTWGNITTRDEGECGLKLWRKTEGPKGVLVPIAKICASIEPGSYATPQTLIDALYGIFEKLKRWDADPSIGQDFFALRDVLDISHDVHTDKLTFTMKENPYRCDAVTLKLSSTLLSLTGHEEYGHTNTDGSATQRTSISLALNGDNGVSKSKTLTRIVNLKAGIHNIFCYSNLVKNITVGDTQAPLLRIIPVRGKDGEYVYESFEDRQYLPLGTNNFNTIDVLIGDRFGNRIKFNHGSAPVILVLHLRRIA